MKSKNLVLVVLLAVLSGIAGYVCSRYLIVNNDTTASTGSVPETGTKEKRLGGYRFINPLLECDNYQPATLNSVVVMQQKVKGYIDESVKSGKVAFVSVYYRDLNFGPWMGINETEKFSAASLLKVPVMIAVYKKEEAQPGFLSTEIAYTTALGKTATGLKAGNRYTVQKLTEEMLINSDDGAKQLLEQALGSSFVTAVMADIGVNATGNDGAVSIKDYSGFFRMLYNATYLSHTNSEKALAMLSRVNYNNGLSKGLPEGVLLANKQGGRTDGTVKQLHECGIVYYNGGPYLLGVMTRGNDVNQLSTVIADLSSMVYSEVSGVAAPAK